MAPKHIIWNYAQAVSYRVNTSFGSKGLISEKWVWAIERGVPLSLFRIHHCFEWIGMMQTTFNFVLNVLIYIHFPTIQIFSCVHWGLCCGWPLREEGNVCAVLSSNVAQQSWTLEWTRQVWSWKVLHSYVHVCTHHLWTPNTTFYIHISMIWWSILYTLHIR